MHLTIFVWLLPGNFRQISFHNAAQTKETVPELARNPKRRTRKITSRLIWHNYFRTETVYSELNFEKLAR